MHVSEGSGQLSHDPDRRSPIWCARASSSGSSLWWRRLTSLYSFTENVGAITATVIARCRVEQHDKMKDRLQRPRRCQNGADWRYNMPLVETANSQHTVRTVVRGAPARWHHLISCCIDKWRQNRLRWSQPQVADSMSPNMKCFWYMRFHIAD